MNRLKSVTKLFVSCVFVVLHFEDFIFLHSPGSFFIDMTKLPSHPALSYDCKNQINLCSDDANVHWRRHLFHCAVLETARTSELSIIIVFSRLDCAIRVFVSSFETLP